MKNDEYSALSLEHRLHRIGANLWDRTYGQKMTDHDVWRSVCQTLLAEGIGSQLDAGDKILLKPSFDMVTVYALAIKWVHGACRMIETDDKYGAAMALTGMTADAATELRIPWPVFAVRLPKGLFISASGVEYTFAVFGQFDNHHTMLNDGTVKTHALTCAYYIGTDDETKPGFWGCEPGMSLADEFFEEAQHEDPDHFLNDPRWQKLYGQNPEAFSLDRSDRRIVAMVKRMTVGLLYTMQHTKSWTFGGHFNRASGGQLRKEPPPHRVIIVGRPIDIDVREAARSDAASGAHKSPSVQTLVRGHIKRQVVGAGRSGRKVIWIEPYWRGPKDAPILARPVKVVNARKAKP